MSDQRQYIVASGLDDPIPFLWWDVHEVLFALLLVGVGIVIRSMIFGLVSAAIVLWLFKKFKSGSKTGQTLHLLWRTGCPVETSMKKAGFPKPTRVEFFD